MQISKSWIWRSCREEREGARNIASPESSISNDAADDDEDDEDDVSENCPPCGGHDIPSGGQTTCVLKVL